LPKNEGPGDNPEAAALGFNDSHWDQVQLPHDGLVAQGADNTTCPTGCSGRSYIPRVQMWYRKTFTLPAAWEQASSSSVWIEFDGIFRATIVYLNGKIVARNSNGYIGFQVSLTEGNATGLLRGKGKPNVLALFVDPDTGAGFSHSKRTGWWYEGGGLYRHARIVRGNNFHFASNGFVARSTIGTGHVATLTAAATVRNAGPAAVVGGSTYVSFSVVEQATGKAVGNSSVVRLSSAIAPGASISVASSISIASPMLWNSRAPALYTITAKLFVESAPAASIDAVDITHGIREITFSGAPNTPSCTLNRKTWKWRGFCDHDNFAVVGTAVPDRVKLFRAQMSRAVGGNSRRTSHNPPDPIMLSIYDRLGMLVMDETRIFNSAPTSVDAMRALVERDRNHPSVAMWSFCNEAACEPPKNNPTSSEPQAGAPLFQQAVVAADPTRPTSGNTPGWSGHYPPFIKSDLLTETIGIQGFSHAGSHTPDSFHGMSEYATKPIFGSECCSCNTMRDEDVGCESSNGQQVCIQKSFAAECAQAQTSVYDLPEWIVGTMVSAHSPPLHSSPLHSPPLHSPPLHSPPLHSPPLHSPPLHFPPLYTGNMLSFSSFSSSPPPVLRSGLYSVTVPPSPFSISLLPLLPCLALRALHPLLLMLIISVPFFPTIQDYYGEPSGGWPYAISSYGQFDLSGFPKAQGERP
jgi:hypothetical protein